jgi:hypothetical protein
VFGWIGPVGVLAMNSVHHGWFFDNKEWIEFIIATVVLWLLMMTAVYELDLRSAGWPLDENQSRAVRRSNFALISNFANNIFATSGLMPDS